MYENHFVIGQTVYSSFSNKVAVGEVIKINKVRLDGQGYVFIDEDGPLEEYVARFSFDTLRQTYPWKFFDNKEDATRKVISDIELQISDHRFKISSLECCIAILKSDIGTSDK